MQIIFHQKVSPFISLAVWCLSLFFFRKCYNLYWFNSIVNLCFPFYSTWSYCYLFTWCTCIYLVDKTSLFLPPKISLKQISYAQFETDTNLNISFWFTCMQVCIIWQKRRDRRTCFVPCNAKKEAPHTQATGWLCKDSPALYTGVVIVVVVVVVVVLTRRGPTAGKPVLWMAKQVGNYLYDTVG